MKTSKILVPALLVALLGSGMPAWADRPTAPQRVQRVQRNQAFKRSLSTTRWQVRKRFVPRSESRNIPKQPTLKVHSLGQVMVLRTVEPGRAQGVEGKLIKDYVKLRPRGTASPNQLKAKKSFSEVMSLTEKRFDLGQVKHATLFAEAVKGVLKSPSTDSRGAYRAAMSQVTSSLGDKYSRYFAPQGWKKDQLRSSGKAQGLGITMKAGTSGVRVEQVVKGSPADGALRTGDRVLKVAGRAVRSTEDVQRAVSGNLDRATPLTVERQGQRKTVTVTPRIYKVKLVTSELKGRGIGAVKLARFAKGSAEQVRQAVSDLQRRNGGRLNGLVLDLRGNPGGLTAEAQSLLNMFIPSGDLFYFSRHKKVVKRHTADPNQTPFADLRLTVLVDKKSASSSEIVAGSLKQRGRATLVGENTFGKGIGQSNWTLPDGSGFRLTDFHIGLPVEGKSSMVLYHKQGIKPHVAVPPDQAMDRALTTF